MRIQSVIGLLATLAVVSVVPARAQDAAKVGAAAQWDAFLEHGTVDDVNAAMDAIDGVGYDVASVDAGKCRANAGAMADAQRRLPVSMAVQRAALLCAEAIGDHAAADRASTALAALAREAFAEADRGAWPRPVRIVVPADAYALFTSAGLDFRYELYGQLRAMPYFPLMIAAVSPDTGVEKLIQFDYVDVLQAVDRKAPSHGTPRLRASYVETFIDSAVKRDDIAAIDFMAVKAGAAEDDPAKKIAALRDATTKGGLNAASNWLMACALHPAKGCADGLVDALLPRAEARNAYPMMLLALAYAEGVGVERDQASAEAMLDAADRVWEHNGASVAYGNLQALLHPDQPLQPYLRQRLVQARDAGNSAAMVLALSIDLANADKAYVLKPAEEALLALPEHNGMGQGLLKLYGWYASRDKAKSDNYLQRAADANNAAALSIVAFRLREAQGNRPASPEMIGWMEKAANGGDPYAMHYLAYHALVGGDPKRAEDWVITAASQGNVNALFFLASLWADGYKDMSGDAKNAVAIYESLAEVPDEGPRARRRLASMAIAGKGMDKDLARAKAWLTKDAEAGDIESQAELGSRLMSVTLGPADTQAGRKWLQRAIKAGSVEAMNMYGLWLHNQGEGAADRAEGVMLSKQAAEKGDSGALNNLAWMLCTSVHDDVRKPADGMIYIHKLEAIPDLDPGTVDTLAACYAATGEYPRAVELQQQVIGNMRKLPDPDLENIKEMEARLALYQANKTYIEPAPGK